MRGVNKRSAAAEDEVEASASAVSSAGAANRRNLRRVPRSGKPVVDRGTDLAALDRPVAGPVMTGDQVHDALAAINRLFERAIDGAPSCVEVHAVQIDHAIRFDSAGPKLAIPSGIERCSGLGAGFGCIRRWRFPQCSRPLPRRWFLLFYSCLRVDSLTRERPDAGRDLGPERGLVRAERAQAEARLWAAGSAPRPMPTCRRQSPPLPARRPRRCRTGWDL